MNRFYVAQKEAEKMSDIKMILFAAYAELMVLKAK